MVDFPRGTDAPSRGLPWYKSTLTIQAVTIRAEDGGEVSTDRVSVTVVPSAGLMHAGDGLWVTLPSESEEAYTKLTAGLTPRPARTLPGVGVDGLPAARVDEVVEFASAADAAPASDGSNVWIVALGGGVLAALMVGLLLWMRHRRADAASGARGTRSGVTRRAASGRPRGGHRPVLSPPTRGRRPPAAGRRASQALWLSAESRNAGLFACETGSSVANARVHAGYTRGPQTAAIMREWRRP